MDEEPISEWSSMSDFGKSEMFQSLLNSAKTCKNIRKRLALDGLKAIDIQFYGKMHGDQIEKSLTKIGTIDYQSPEHSSMMRAVVYKWFRYESVIIVGVGEGMPVDSLIYP